jgi:hypothetical protein
VPINRTDDETDVAPNVDPDVVEAESGASVNDLATDQLATEDEVVKEEEVAAEADVEVDEPDRDTDRPDDDAGENEPPASADPPEEPPPPPVMIGEPWFFPDRIAVVKASPDPDDISADSVDHHVISRPSRLGKKWQVALLSSIVIVVLVALMITGGRALRSSGVSTRPKVPAPAGVPSSWIAYRDPNSAFLIWHPPTWTVDRSGTTTDFTDPATETRFRVDHYDPTQPPLDRQWLQAEKTFAPNHPEYERLQIVPTTYGGAPAALWEYTYFDGRTSVHAADLGFSTKTSGYTLAFQANSQDWDQLLPLFTAFKRSFRVPPGS